MDQLFTTNIWSITALSAALLPLISFVLILLGKKAKGTKTAISVISVSFIISVFVFFQIWNKQPLHFQFNWFSIGQNVFTAGVLLNNLSVLMMVLVTGIALLVHIYSVEYMKGDPYLHRYWAYLGLFCFSMLGVVLADNLFLVYIFWELVGFSSYLLIGFWFTKDAASQASKKAFIMNRIGDLGFLLGIIILYTQFQTLDIEKLFGNNGLLSLTVIKNGYWVNGIHQLPQIWITIAGISLFLGAVAKSAQFPLHTWLPDAMEGPTSVSSLIHAATMVAAGVFLIARVFPVFDSTVLSIITVIGIFTAFMAATIALTQNDLKRILAYSTISQLGFMMLALGIGAVGEGLFHLSTHAFFKCLLFLCAGAIIHQVHHFKENNHLEFDHQDIRNMGGLRKQMPITFWAMFIAAMSLIGFPFFSGYLSKDAILIKAFEWAEIQNGIWKIVPYLGIITSWLTTFYIGRLIFKVFYAKAEIEIKVKDPSWYIKLPLIILAISCLFPLFSWNPLQFEESWILNGFPVKMGLHRENIFHTIIPATVNLVSVLILYITFYIYAKKPKRLSQPNILVNFSKEAWYINPFYQLVFVMPVNSFARVCYAFDKTIIDGFINLLAQLGVISSKAAVFIDKNVVDRLVNLTGSISKSIGNLARFFQTGKLQHYLVSMLLIVLTFFILKYFTI